MASPQPDHFTRLSNELLEAITFYPFKAKELRIFLAIVRQTYGWGRKSNLLSTSYLSKVTNLHETLVRKALKSLRQKNIVLVDGYEGRFRVKVLKINKNYEEWEGFDMGSFFDRLLITQQRGGQNCSPLAVDNSPRGVKTAPPRGVKTAPPPIIIPKETDKETYKGRIREHKVLDSSKSQHCTRRPFSLEKISVSHIIRGKEKCITNGDPRTLVNFLTNYGFDFNKIWGAIVQARSKSNPIGYFCKLISAANFPVADSAMEQAKIEIRRFST